MVNGPRGAGAQSQPNLVAKKTTGKPMLLQDDERVAVAKWQAEKCPVNYPEIKLLPVEFKSNYIQL